MRAALLPIAALACAVGCSPAGAAPASAPTTPATSPASAALHALFDAEWDTQMREWPTWASELGDHRFDDRWPDLSPAGFARRAAHARDVQVHLRTFDPAALPSADRLSLAVFERQIDDEVDGEPFRLWHLVLDQRDGVQTADTLADAIAFSDVAAYRAWIARMGALPDHVDHVIATMREGIGERIVQPRVPMERIPAQIARQVVDDPERSPFWAPFTRMPASIPEADRAALRADGRKAIAAAVVPAYRRFGEFFGKEYLPACFQGVGAWQLPHGDEAYAYLARHHTTTRMTPQEIHDVGLREVARIRSEMLAVMQRVGFKGGLPDFFAWLRRDPQFFYPDAASLLVGYEAMAKRIDPRLVTQFRTLPRTPYGVQAIPDEVAPDTSTAYYREPAADGSRAGTFFVNLYEPRSRPRWEMTALTLHESVPGHHLQIAIASEQTGLPAFRRFGSFTAFVEGWGVYAESLGEDMGLYDDPYAKFGELVYQMWRSVRLVVDTGMHALHWDRQKAIDTFLENTPRSELDVGNEVDRYVAWPGQALAYKIGQLEISRLREHARAELGARFDVRAFHDAVLRDGALPLDVLADNVEAWIAQSHAADVHSTPR
jgi:uncharacterized protein (DUF885 family)